MFTHTTEILALIGGIIAVAVAFFMALIKRVERKTRKDSERDVLNRQLKEMQQAWVQSKKVDYETSKKSDAGVSDELKRNWMRK